MPWPSATSDPAHSVFSPFSRLMRIQYNFLRRQMLTSQVTGVNSKASAHEWALGFRDRWHKLLDSGKAVGADPASDPEIQHALNNLRLVLLDYITSDWVDLAPAILGDFLSAARMLPPGNSLVEGYDEFLNVPSTPRAAAAVLPAPAASVPSASPNPHLASTGSGLSRLVPLPSHAASSSPTSLGARHPVHPSGRDAVLPGPVPVAGAPSVSASTPPEAASAPPAKRAKRAARSSTLRSVDLMPKTEIPRNYIRCKLCRRQKVRCAPLRGATPPYVTCGRCEIAGVPCVPMSGSAPVPLSAPKAASAPHRNPSPSVAEFSSRASTPAWYTQDERKVLEDGYPLEPKIVPVHGTASAPLADILALNAEVTASTTAAIQTMATVRAATQASIAARLRWKETRAAERAAVANFRAFVARRQRAWEHLIYLLGDDAFGSAGPKSGRASRPAASELEGSADGDSESDDAGDASVEGMLM